MTGPLFFADRSRKADDYPYLAWKVRLFTVGAVLAVFGMVQDDNRIIAVATFFLLIGFLLRFMPGGKGVVEGEEEEEAEFAEPFEDSEVDDGDEAHRR